MKGIIYHDNDWIAGVEYENTNNEYNDNEEADYEEEEEAADEEEENEDKEDNRHEMEDILHEPPNNNEDNWTIEDEDANFQAEDDNNEENEANNDNDSEIVIVFEPDNNDNDSEIEIVFEPDNDDNHDSDEDFEVEETKTIEDIIEESTEEPRRSNRAPKPREFLQPSMKGKTYIQTEAEVEYCQNLITHISPNPEQDEQYCPSNAILIAKKHRAPQTHWKWV